MYAIFSLEMSKEQLVNRTAFHGVQRGFPEAAYRYFDAIPTGTQSDGRRRYHRKFQTDH